MTDSRLRWPFFALFALIVAALVTFLAMRMVSNQQIGLSSEPLSAGEQLVPRERVARARRQPPSSAALRFDAAPAGTTSAAAPAEDSRRGSSGEKEASGTQALGSPSASPGEPSEHENGPGDD